MVAVSREDHKILHALAAKLNMTLADVVASLLRGEARVHGLRVPR
jgi:hypothetical protein